MPLFLQLKLTLRNPIAIDQKQELILTRFWERNLAHAVKYPNLCQLVGETQRHPPSVDFIVSFQMSQDQLYCSITQAICERRINRESLGRRGKFVHKHSCESVH